MKMTTPHRTKDNVFDDLGFDPAEAEILKAKSALMNSIIDYLKQQDITQQDAANIMGVNRARISDVCRGNISKFTIDMLLAMNTRAGLHPLTIAA
jgi:predicted XRE-type DNA-binding protein